MQYIMQEPHWEVTRLKFNMSFSDLYETTSTYKTEDEAFEAVAKCQSPEKLISVKKVYAYLPVPQNEVW